MRLRPLVGEDPKPDPYDVALLEAQTVEEIKAVHARFAKRKEEVLAVGKHATHNQKDHGNRYGHVREGRSTKSYTIFVSDGFRSPQEVEDYIVAREAEEGGAWAYSATFGLVDIVRATVPSKVPDDYISLHGSRKQLYWQGAWRDFSEAAVIREQWRGIDAQ